MSNDLMNSIRRLANQECESLVGKIGDITKVKPSEILIYTPYGATMKFTYTFYNGTVTIAPQLNDANDGFVISAVAHSINDDKAFAEIPLGETIRIRLALLNEVTSKANVIDFNKK